ncbi:hypothetical protein JKG47_03055 [Acidithiobacillus sp. MC6.1]|nr:hypothetical protein [Acidithiobacillus sp. MC6.1]
MTDRTPSKCFRCMDTGKVLSMGMHQCEPCLRCKPDDRTKWEAEQAVKKEHE